MVDYPEMLRVPLSLTCTSRQAGAPIRNLKSLGLFPAGNQTAFGGAVSKRQVKVETRRLPGTFCRVALVGDDLVPHLPAGSLARQGHGVVAASLCNDGSVRESLPAGTRKHPRDGH